MAEQTIAPNEIKVGWEPDRDRLRALVERPGGVSETEFFQAMSPKTWEVPQADTVDRLLNTLGIVTPGVAAGRKRGEEYEQLAPLYKEFMARKLGNVFAPTQAEAIDRGLIPSPSVAPQSMMPGPRVETAPSNIDQALAPTGAAPSVGMALRPGMTGQGLDPLDLRGQPLGGHFQTASLPLPGLVPQETGPFGVSPFQERQPQPPAYQPPTMAPGPMVPNMQAPLRPIDQAIVAAQTHAMGLRQPAAHAQGDYPYRDNIAKLEAAAIAENDGRPLSARQIADIAETVHKTFNPVERPGSTNARKAKAEADTAMIESEKRAKVLDATIAEKTAQASWETQQALDAAGMFQAKLKYLASQTNLNDVNAGRVGQTVFNQQAVIELQRASKTLDGIKAAWAMGNVDEQGLMALMKSYLETTQKQLQLQGVPPNAISELLGFPPSQMTTVPGMGGPPPVSGMTGSITPSTSSVTPQTPQAPVVNKAEEELKALERANPGYEYQRKSDGTLQRRKKS